jgi:serine/threonine kinase 16
MINANLVNHTRFPEKKLMALMLGVCKALKSMHQYKMGGAGGDAGGKPSKQRSDHPEDGEEVENEPLMESEVTRSQEGVAAGQRRAYAHRDIKPGKLLFFACVSTTKTI